MLFKGVLALSVWTVSWEIILIFATPIIRLGI